MYAPRSHRLSLLSLALASQGVMAASFLPGADPPTGERVELASPEAAEPLRAGNGIRWEFGPWRQSGTLSLDKRWVRLSDGLRTSQTLAIGDAEFSSYIWQPWFIQVRLGATVMGSRASGEGSSASSGGTSLGGRLGLSVFPASRFPFEFRFDSSDSRTSGDSLTGDFTSRRVSLSQGYRPARGNDQYQVSIDRSVIEDAQSRDTLTTLNATALRQFDRQTLDIVMNHSEHMRSDSEDRTRLSSVSARHGYAASQALQVETMASWNEFWVGRANLETGSDVRQVSSYATWRPSVKFGWAGASQPLVAATARWVQVQSFGNEGNAKVQAINVSLGASQELGTGWRTSVSGNASELRSRTVPDGRSVGAQGTLSWSPPGTALGSWRYVPGFTTNLGFYRGSDGLSRENIGAQASHSLSRDIRLDREQNISLGVNQSAGILHEAGVSPSSVATAYGANLSWQRVSNQGSQSSGGLSYSDARTRAAIRGRFQLVNLLVSQRVQLTRQSSWSANATVQASRNQSTEIDVFTGQMREIAPGWQRFYSAALSYDHQRAFGVPRLRYSLLVSANSQVVEKRSLGDIEAPRERISESLESRLDYNIGRLETRLTARAARVEGKMVSSIQARAQRRF